MAQQNYHYPKNYLINSVFLNPSLLLRFKWILVKFYFLFKFEFFIFMYRFDMLNKNNFSKNKKYYFIVTFLKAKEQGFYDWLTCLTDYPIS